VVTQLDVALQSFKRHILYLFVCAWPHFDIYIYISHTVKLGWYFFFDSVNVICLEKYSTAQRGKVGHLILFKSKLKIVKSIFCEFFPRKVCMNYGTSDSKA